jgi:hypothetical protein
MNDGHDSRSHLPQLQLLLLFSFVSRVKYNELLLLQKPVTHNELCSNKQIPSLLPAKIDTSDHPSLKKRKDLRLSVTSQ